MRFTQIIFLCLLLDACAVGKDYKLPSPPVDNTWSEIDIGKPSNILLSQTPQPTSAQSPWWNRFHDEKFSALEERALAKNNDLKDVLTNVSPLPRFSLRLLAALLQPVTNPAVLAEIPLIR